MHISADIGPILRGEKVNIYNNVQDATIKMTLSFDVQNYNIPKIAMNTLLNEVLSSLLSEHNEISQKIYELAETIHSSLLKLNMTKVPSSQEQPNECDINISDHVKSGGEYFALKERLLTKSRPERQANQYEIKTQELMRALSVGEIEALMDLISSKEPIVLNNFRTKFDIRGDDGNLVPIDTPQQRDAFAMFVVSEIAPIYREKMKTTTVKPPIVNDNNPAVAASPNNERQRTIAEVAQRTAPRAISSNRQQTDDSQSPYDSQIQQNLDTTYQRVLKLEHFSSETNENSQQHDSLFLMLSNLQEIEQELQELVITLENLISKDINFRWIDKSTSQCNYAEAYVQDYFLSYKNNIIMIATNIKMYNDMEIYYKPIATPLNNNLFCYHYKAEGYVVSETMDKYYFLIDCVHFEEMKYLCPTLPKEMTDCSHSNNEHLKYFCEKTVIECQEWKKAGQIIFFTPLRFYKRGRHEFNINNTYAFEISPQLKPNLMMKSEILLRQLGTSDYKMYVLSAQEQEAMLQSESEKLPEEEKDEGYLTDGEEEFSILTITILLGITMISGITKAIIEHNRRIKQKNNVTNTKVHYTPPKGGSKGGPREGSPRENISLLNDPASRIANALLK